jgi:hypothetical protein
MLGFFMLPMLQVFGRAFTENKHYRVTHFGLTIFYGVILWRYELNALSFRFTITTYFLVPNCSNGSFIFDWFIINFCCLPVDEITIK